MTTKTVHIQKAEGLRLHQPGGVFEKRNPPNTFIIINDDGFEGPMNHKKDAKELVNALYKSLPGATLDEALILLLQKRSRALVVSRAEIEKKGEPEKIEIIESPRPE